MNVSGLRKYVYDSYGNPITERDEKPKPTDKEIIKTQYVISKKNAGPSKLNPYYEAAYNQRLEKMQGSGGLPPTVPKNNGGAAI